MGDGWRARVREGEDRGQGRKSERGLGQERKRLREGLYLLRACVSETVTARV